MRIGVRGKLFAVSVLLILVVGLASGAYLEDRLRSWLDARVDGDLAWRLRAARLSLEAAPSLPGVPATDRLADELGRALGCRVTVIARDGVVLGDSHVELARIPRIDNHGRRPEVLAALRQGWGQSERYSITDGGQLRYRAARYHRRDGSHGVVRVAVTLQEVERAVHALRLLLVAAGGVGLAIAVLMSALASHLQWRAVLDLLRDPRALAAATGGEVVGSPEAPGGTPTLRRDLQRAVGTLAAERDRFDAVLQGLSEAVLALDAEQRVTLANPAALELLELSSSPVGSTLLEVIRVPAVAELAGAARAGRPGTTEFELLGTTRSVLARATPLGSGRGTVLVLLDVSDVRRLEAVRRDFVANASHELRTPISVIRANAETLLDGALADPEHARPMLEALLRNADRMARVVSDLLDISRIESGGWELHPGAVDVAGLADVVVERLGSQAEARGLAVEVKAEPGTRVRADAKALDLVLSNLVENAVKYTDEGGHVEVDVAVAGDRVTIEVRDDGAGIEPRHRDRIFERFYRVDPGRSRAVGGTGLGLSIVRHLVEAMGGKVGMRPATPRGSIFWVELAAARDGESPGFRT